jgi:hypothetical protein
MMKDVLVLSLRAARRKPSSYDPQAKPAVPFGGKYRIIDFAQQLHQFRRQEDRGDHAV